MQIPGNSDQTSENWEVKGTFFIPKTISVIPYPYSFLVSYPLSLKLFGQLSLIPKTPNRASSLYAIFLCVRPEGMGGGGGGVRPEQLVGACGPRPKTLTLFMTKFCDFPHPILDLKK